MIEVLEIKTKRKMQIVVDISMTVMLLSLMAYSMIGEIPHEWLGIAMLLLFVVHLALNARWFTVLFKGRYTPIRIFGTIINILLIFNMLCLMVSGMFISRYVLDFLPIHRGSSIARIVHLLSSYWSFVLMSVHIGLHWNMVMGRIWKAKYATESSAIRVRILRLFVICSSIYGVYAFIDRRLGKYMLFKSQFAFFDYEESLLLFMIDYLAIMFLFGTVGYYFGRGFSLMQSFWPMLR